MTIKIIGGGHYPPPILGVAFPTQLNGNEDLDDIINDGKYFTDGPDNLSKKPSSELYNNLIVVIRQKRDSPHRVIQYFYCFNEKQAFIRMKSEVGWGSWWKFNGVN